MAKSRRAGAVPLAAILTSASPHDSQLEIPLMQMPAKRVKVLYDLADSACDAPEIYQVSKTLSIVLYKDTNIKKALNREIRKRSGTGKNQDFGGIFKEKPQNVFDNANKRIEANSFEIDSINKNIDYWLNSY